MDEEYHTKTNARHIDDYNAGKLNFEDSIAFQLTPPRDNPREVRERIREQFVTAVIEPMIT